MFWIDECACVLFFCSSGMCGHKILVGRFHKEKYGKCMQFLQRSFGVPSCKLPGRPCKVTFPKGSFIFQAWFFRGYVKLRECTKRTPRLKMIQTLETWGPIGGSTNCMVGRWKIVFFCFAFLNPFLGGGLFICVPQFTPTFFREMIQFGEQVGGRKGSSHQVSAHAACQGDLEIEPSLLQTSGDLFFGRPEWHHSQKVSWV